MDNINETIEVLTKKGQNISSYNRDLIKLGNNTAPTGVVDKAVAEDMVVKYLTQKRRMLMDIQQSSTSSSSDDATKTKEDMRKEKDNVRNIILECLLSNSINVRNMELGEFIDEMVSEYGGYSILDEAFADPDINDIFCLGWNRIFVEKNGKNQKYWKSFRNEEHYNKVVERFLRIDGKELNIGDKKIVDFELYGDRGCATSTAVTPRGITMTLRKHKEVNIILDELLEYNVMTEEMKELFGLIVDGEANLIYAGITGSGKTTTIRAILDYFVPKNQKRMLVCEDTQELFPKNEHTMEMVSTKSDKEAMAISLYQLILTSLRLKPKYIVVGEVRGMEAQAAVEAMETGHSTIFTMHGGTVWNNINRLVTKYLMAMPSLGIEVVERIIGSAVDFVAIQDDIPGVGRVVSSIDELTFDFNARRIRVRNIFKFDTIKKDFVFLNRISEEKASKMMRRGVDVERIKDWIHEGLPDAPDKQSENDIAFIDKINDTYHAEKNARQEEYNKRRQERKDRRAMEDKVRLGIATNEDVEVAIITQRLKDLEVVDMLDRINKISDISTESGVEK